MRRKRYLFLFVVWVLSFGLLGLHPTDSSGESNARVLNPSELRNRSYTSYGQLPMHFEANRGQFDDRVDFATRGSGYSLFLTGTEAVFALEVPTVSQSRITPGGLPLPDAVPVMYQTTILRMELVGGSVQPDVSGMEPLPGIVNYFIGNEPDKWVTDIPTYAAVGYQDVYPGIDLRYYGNQAQLQYDFIVAPSADPAAIRLRFTQAEHLEVDMNGDLLLALPGGTLRQQAPFTYQEVDGKRIEVPSQFVLLDGGQVGFIVSAYDSALPLVIDPPLVYSTYLGGSWHDVGTDIAVDTTGAAFVTGYTSSVDFPTVNPYQTNPNGETLYHEEDIFLTKLSPDGSSILYSTYIGGTSDERPSALTIDNTGAAYVTGYTLSNDFPTRSAFQGSSPGGSTDAFITKLSPAGNALSFSTYLGGSDGDGGNSIAVDGSGSAYVTGYTGSTNFPTRTPFQTDQPQSDGFVTKLTPGGNALVYSTYLGGASSDQSYGITVDANGSAYIVGITKSSDFPTRNPVHTFRGNYDVFVTKLTPAGNNLAYSTYLGGTWADHAYSIQVDGTGSAYVAGFTESINFPILNAFQETNHGTRYNAFVTKLNPSGNSLVYSTYIGGSVSDLAYAIAIDYTGAAYITGESTSSDFPLLDAYQTDQGIQDAFITCLSPSGDKLLYSTYLGGNGYDYGNGITVDSNGAVYVTGFGDSVNFPVQNPYQGDQAETDAFVTKFGPTPVSGSIEFTTTGGGTVAEAAGTYNAEVRLTVVGIGILDSPISVDVTFSGVAVPGMDYTPAGPTHTVTFTTPGGFPSGVYSQSMTLNLIDDTLDESDEPAILTLNNSGSSVELGATLTHTVTITDSDPPPQISIDNVSVTEGNSGTTDATFTVSLSHPTYQTVTADYATADDSATTADNDYAATSGILTFAPADPLTKTVTVTVNGDIKFEPDETFFVNLSNASNAVIADAQGIGTITNDDQLPQVSVDNVSVTEANSGTVNATFTVSLSHATYQTVTVNYATADDSATTTDNDYATASGTLTFAPNNLSETVTVTVNGDTKLELDETFFINLSNPSNASIGDGQGVGTITNDDGIPQLSINDVSVTEGNSGTVNATFTVNLSHPTYQTITVDYATADDSATTADNDYTAASGTLSFAPDDLSETITVLVNGDLKFEPDETFFVTLNNPSNATLQDAHGTGTIINDEGMPQLRIDDVSVTEGNSGTVSATFSVSLSNPTTQTVEVSYTTADDSAMTADSDYEAASGTLTFEPTDPLTQTVTVTVNGDLKFEPDETFFVTLSSANHATITDAQGIGTITNDDGVPQLSIDDVSVPEGNSGTVTATFTVSLSHPTYQNVTVDFVTADASATIADQDYRSASGTLTFAPDTVRKTIVVTVYGDTRYELDETFTITLSDARFATVSDNQGMGTIVNDDAPPALSIDDVTVFERGSGKGRAVFTVSLDTPIGLPITVAFASADGTATVNSDYAPAAGTLTFTPGATRRQVMVTTFSDTLAEGAETFFLNLSQPTNATIGDAQGIATIRDQVPTLRAPTNRSAIADNTPTLIWNTLRDATHYRLQLDNNADFSSPLVTRVLTGTRYTPSTSLPDWTYYWRVQARDGLGNWGGWSSRWSFTVDTTTLAAPVLLSPANGSIINGNRPVFRWQAVSGATNYMLQVDNQSTFASPVINTMLAATNYSPATSLVAGTYFWRVRAQDTAGHQSRWSSPWRFTIASAASVPFSPAAATNTPTRLPTVISTATPTTAPTQVVIAPLQRVESTDSVVIQAGTWTAHTTDAASGGSYLYSSSSFDDGLRLAFVGTQVEVIYVKHSALGTFAVEIDGTVLQLVNSVALESEFGAVTLVSGLVDGSHTLHIYPVAGVVALDAFGVEALPDVPIPTSTDTPTQDVTTTGVPSDLPTPTDLPPGESTLTPTATTTPLPVTLPFVETFDSGLNWQPTGSWIFDSQTAYQGAGWFGDSNTRGQSSTLTSDFQIDLRTALNPELSYWTKLALVAEDQFAIEVSLDNGLSWQILDLHAGQVIDWTQRVVDLTAYCGQVIRLHFRLDTLNALPENVATVGIWVDELVIQEAQLTPTLTDAPTHMPAATEVPTSTPVPTETLTTTPTVTPLPSETPTEVPTAIQTTTPTSAETSTETPMPYREAA